MKRKISIPFVTWRDGRPRFSPSATLRRQGYQGQDLRHPEGEKIAPADLELGSKNTGDWFGPGEAMDWSAAFTKRIAEAQKKAKATETKRPAKPKPNRAPALRATRKKGPYPLGRLIEDWKRSPSFRDDKAEKTRRDYASKMSVLEEAYPDVWAAEIDALDQPILFSIYEDMRRKRGLPMAKGTIRVLSSAISWGLRTGKFDLLKVNPAKDLGMATPDPRVRFASRLELDTLIAVADHVGRHDMGDSFVAAVWSGQRQGDRLHLQEQEELRDTLICKQSKTGEIVQIPIAPQFQSRRAAASFRRQQAGVVSNQLILFENQWKPFKADNYRHLFGDIRRVAVNGLWRAPDGQLVCPVNDGFRYLKNVKARAVSGTCLVKPCRSLADFQEADFRDTAVTWLGLAGATVPEICAVTGHSPQSATQVLRHYLAMHPEMAKSAISKMVAWYDADGETEIKI